MTIEETAAVDREVKLAIADTYEECAGIAEAGGDACLEGCEIAALIRAKTKELFR